MRLVKPMLALALAGLMPALPSNAQGLKDFGSFHVGGRQVTLEGYPPGASVTVYARPPGGGNCCGIKVAEGIVTDVVGRGSASFVVGS